MSALWPRRTVAGCSALYNVVPLSDLKPGAYELTIWLGEPDMPGTLKAARPFRIE